ncbi:class I SAM-dependent methyltransferase [Aeromonas veronii]
MNLTGLLRKSYHKLILLPIFGGLIRKIKDVVYNRLERRITYRGFSDIHISHNALRKDIQNLKGLNDYALNIIKAQSKRLDECMDIKAFEDFKEFINADMIRNYNRIEFIRSEILFEIRKNKGVGEESQRKKNVQEIATKIINPEKLEQKSLKLNIGCGHKLLDDYINVDMRHLPGVDVVSTVNKLDFASGKIDEIYCSHLIEHFTEIELINHILPYWKYSCNDGAIIRIVVPDTLSMIRDVENGTMSFEDFRVVTLGAQDYDGDFHYSIFSFNSLKDILENAGFKKVSLVRENVKNGLCKEMEIECIA